MEVKGCHPTDRKPWNSLVGSVEYLTHCVVLYLFNKFQLRNIARYSFCHFLNISFIGFIKSTFKRLSGCWHKQIAGLRLQPRFSTRNSKANAQHPPKGGTYFMPSNLVFKSQYELSFDGNVPEDISKQWPSKSLSKKFLSPWTYREIGGNAICFLDALKLYILKVPSRGSNPSWA